MESVSLPLGPVTASVIQQEHEDHLLAVEHLSLTLQVWRYTGGKPKPAEFLDRIVVSPDDTAKKRKTPNPRVDVMFIERSEFANAEEPSESFAAELETRLTEAATWLDKQPTNLFKSLRSSGFTTESCSLN